MLDFDKLFKLAKDKGIEDIQIVYASDKSTSIEFCDNELDNFTINTSNTLSAKAIYNGKMGYYATEVLEESEFPNIINELIESAKYISNDEKVFIYEGDKDYKKLEGLYNEELSKIDVKDKIELVRKLNSLSKEKEYVTVAESFYSEGESYILLKNSKGLNLESHTNDYTIGTYVIVSKDNDTRNSYESFESNDYSLIDLDKLINTAYNDAYNSIGAKPVKSGKYEIVLSEDVTASLLSTFCGMFSSERAQKDMSVLKGRVNEKIASSCVTIVDNPFLESSLNRQSFDSEGVKTRYKEVVENGVFKGFIYNLKTAYKENRESTGNASGSSVGFNNIYFKPGERTKDEIISSITNGIYISDVAGLHSGANPLSMEFSLQATGYVIKGGKLESPVALITISDNYMNVLKNITEVSSELKNGVDCPSIRIKEIAVSGL